METSILANRNQPSSAFLWSFKPTFWAFVGSAKLAASAAPPNRDFATVGTLKLRGFGAW